MNIKTLEPITREHRPERRRNRDPALGIKPARVVREKSAKPSTPNPTRAEPAGRAAEAPLVRPRPRRQTSAGQFGITWENLGVNGIAGHHRQISRSMLARKQKLWPHLLRNASARNPIWARAASLKADRSPESYRQVRDQVHDQGPSSQSRPDFLAFRAHDPCPLDSPVRRGYFFLLSWFRSLSSPHWNEFDRQLFRRSFNVWLRISEPVTRPGCAPAEKTISTKVPSCSLLLIVREA